MPYDPPLSPGQDDDYDDDDETLSTKQSQAELALSESAKRGSETMVTS